MIEVFILSKNKCRLLRKRIENANDYKNINFITI